MVPAAALGGVDAGLGGCGRGGASTVDGAIVSRMAAVRLWSCELICSSALAVPTPWALTSSSSA
jgi:hypothetical protein